MILFFYGQINLIIYYHCTRTRNILQYIIIYYMTIIKLLAKMRGHSKCIGRVVAMTSATGYDQFIKECALLGDLLSTRFLMYT